MNFSEYLFERLKSLGVKHVFMLSGGGCMYLTDALGRSGISYTCCLHEQASAIAALAHAQYTGELGVVLVTSGPGATNAITGVMGAWTESVPLLVLSGQVKRADIGWIKGIRTKGVQEAPISDVVKPITKYAVTMLEPSESRYQLEKALHEASSGRKGPVWLDIPLDMQSMEADFEALDGYVPNDDDEHEVGDSQIKQLNELLMKSERPVILAGYGIRASGAIAEFLSCLESLKIPVLTTWKAIDIIPEDHPLYIGRPGVAGQRAANITLQNAGLLICIGARLDIPQIGYEQSLFAREAKKVIIDIDPAELSKWSFDVDLPIHADAKKFLDVLADCAPPKCESWTKHCRELKTKYSLVPAKHYKKTDFTSLYVLVEEISNQLTSDDVIVPGSSGMGSDVSYQVMKIKTGQRMFNSPGLGSMGYGVPSSLGACVASGRKRTICVNGDGGFQMNIQELETIVSKGLPIKFFVINNSGYGSIRNTQRNYFESRYVGSSEKSGVSLPDIMKVGLAYGFDVFKINNNSDISSVVAEVLKSPNSSICEVMVDPDDTLMFRASSILLPDGTSKTAPIEDLYPPLPRKELYGNMFVKPVNALEINLCNLVFDMDGTLIDSSAGITESVLYALKKLGYPVIANDEISRTIGLRLMDMMKQLLPDLAQEKYEELAFAFREHYAETGVLQCDMYEDIGAMLESLSQDFDMYIVTSKPTVFAERILKKFGIDRYFKSIDGVELGLVAKAKNETLRELIKSAGLDPKKTLMIGDRAEDIDAAKQNDIQTVAVGYGYGSGSELSSALRIVETVAELRSILY